MQRHHQNSIPQSLPAYGRCNSTPNTNPKPHVSLSNLLVLRGHESHLADPEHLHKPTLPYAAWVPSPKTPPLRLKMWTHPGPFLPYDKTAVLANNGQMSVECANVAVAKAWKMFGYKAYFHHYVECGLSEDGFKEAVVGVEQIIASYGSLKA